MRVLAALWAFAGFSCSLENPGEEPPRAKLYFPVAVALSAAETGQAAAYLFVANSNFDLKYNSGSVQAYDLAALQSKIAKCGADDECVIDNGALLKDEVLVDSFAAGLAISPKGNRLYVPTRASGNLTFINIKEGGAKRASLLECGQGDGRACADDFKRGDQPVANKQNETMPRDPVGMVVGSIAQFDPAARYAQDDYVLVAHRGGEVSLFLSDRKSKQEPYLADVITGLPERVTGIGVNPADGLAYLTNEWLEEVDVKYLVRVAVHYDDAYPDSTYLFSAGAITLDGISPERDTRAVAFNPAVLPNQALVLTRIPASVSLVDFTKGWNGQYDGLVTKITEVGVGASRMILGKIGADPRLFAFISCFDSRQLYIIDVNLGAPVEVVHGFSGPFEMTLDGPRRLLYVADFRSSVIRVVDLAPIVCRTGDSGGGCEKSAKNDDGLVPCKCLPNRVTRIVATLGQPKPPEELL